MALKSGMLAELEIASKDKAMGSGQTCLIFIYFLTRFLTRCQTIQGYLSQNTSFGIHSRKSLRYPSPPFAEDTSNGRQRLSWEAPRPIFIRPAHTCGSIVLHV